MQKMAVIDVVRCEKKGTPSWYLGPHQCHPVTMLVHSVWGLVQHTKCQHAPIPCTSTKPIWYNMPRTSNSIRYGNSNLLGHSKQTYAHISQQLQTLKTNEIQQVQEFIIICESCIDETRNGYLQRLNSYESIGGQPKVISKALLFPKISREFKVRCLQFIASL